MPETKTTAGTIEDLAQRLTADVVAALAKADTEEPTAEMAQDPTDPILAALGQWRPDKVPATGQLSRRMVSSVNQSPQRAMPGGRGGANAQWWHPGHKASTSRPAPCR